MRTQDIINRIFTRSFMGYDIEEVDRFLDEVIDCIEQYEAEKKEMMTAMEYLLQKLETGSQLPVAEMREAIDGGKSAKKNGTLPETTDDVRIPAKRSAKNTAKQQKDRQGEAETKATARSITRGGSGAPKPVRAPKVSRVAAQQPTEPKAEETPVHTPTAKGEDWLDELLDNLSERDKHGYTTAATAREQQSTSTETEDTTQTAQAVTATPGVNETIAAQKPEPTMQPQPAPQQREASAHPAQQKPEPTAQAKSEQTAPKTEGEHRQAPSMGPQPAEPSTEEAVRSFEATLRTLGEQIRPEAAATPDGKQTGGVTEEPNEHKPKHAAASEDENQ